MTKKELVEWLEDFGDEDLIFFSYPAGDYWHSTIVKEVSSIDVVSIKYSEYFGENILVDENDESWEGTVISFS